MFDGPYLDAIEAASFSHRPQHVDIYSVSWGPDDSGAVLDGPRRYGTDAIKKGNRLFNPTYYFKGKNFRGRNFRIKKKKREIIDKNFRVWTDLSQILRKKLSQILCKAHIQVK